MIMYTGYEEMGRIDSVFQHDRKYFPGRSRRVLIPLLDFVDPDVGNHAFDL